MKRLIDFFEIPATDFSRAVKFYETIFGITMATFDCGNEKMAFFPGNNGKSQGAISWSSCFDFTPSAQGVLISLNCEDISSMLELIEKNGGKTLIAKTKIESDDRGYFAVFTDCEGNRLGLYSE
ncbi:VOC family protein [Dysgonomonas sp. 216]|uniref:VOC family protein n=1 Tax=Dysgonomonas sp. 216 TaxID=2302934 RepID=UPI0013D1198F|nr:VOC family protein [Dysgonomonas sp. 216]NDW19663.1 VOC family protein [Dysgonomonas sp. 216]